MTVNSGGLLSSWSPLAGPQQPGNERSASWLASRWGKPHACMTAWNRSSCARHQEKH